MTKGLKDAMLGVKPVKNRNSAKNKGMSVGPSDE